MIRLLAVIACVWGAVCARGLIEVSKGNEPCRDANWPAGCLDVANAKNRLGYWVGPPFGGGETHFAFRGDNQALSNAISNFAQIKAPSLLIVVHDGVGSCPFFKDDKDPDTTMDYEFTVWTPESFHRLYNAPRGFPLMADQPGYHGELPAPRLDVYVAEGRIDWSAIPVPKVDGLTIQDERAIANGYAAEDGSVVRGTVYDMETSKPVGAAEAIVEQYKQAADNQSSNWEKIASAVADADGRFEIKKVPAGSYTLAIFCNGYAPRAVGYVTLGANTCKSYPAIRLASAVELAGKVIDTSGKPLEGITVRVDTIIALDGRGYPVAAVNDNPKTTTDANGHFAVPNLPRGNARLAVYKEGLHQIDPLAAHDIPAKNLIIKMAATGSIRGTVPVKPNAREGSQSVSVTPEGGNVVGSWGGSMYPKEDGSFEFTDVPPGKYYVGLNLRPDHPEKDPRAKLITVTPGQTTEVEIKN